MSSTMKDIVSRTNGELYIGVVGVVREFGNTSLFSKSKTWYPCKNMKYMIEWL